MFASEIRVCLFWRSRGGHDAPPDMVQQKFQKTKIIGKRHSLSAVESPTPARGRSLFMADMGYMLSGTLCHAGRRRYHYYYLCYALLVGNLFRRPQAVVHLP